MKDEDTAVCKLNEMGDMKGKGTRKVEGEASPSKKEVKPTEPTVPARIISELDVVPAVHTGVKCNACGVCSPLRSDCFRGGSDCYGLGTYRNITSQAHGGGVEYVWSMISATSAIRRLDTNTACSA